MNTFTPILDFWSDEFQSHYCVGLFYTVRHAKLAAIAAKWESEGKIRFLERPKASGMNVQAENSEVKGTLHVRKGS